MLPVVEVAAHMTLPAPLLVQLGSELTVPTMLVHVPHFVPLNSLTMTAAFPLRIAHTTCPLDTSAQDGFPMPFAVPVDTKLPQLAQAEGANIRGAYKNNRQVTIRFIEVPLSFNWTLLCRGGHF
jgi:hypothetical protein